MYNEIIGSISGGLSAFLIFAIFGCFAALTALQVWTIIKLRSLKKQIQVFLDKSTKGNFEGIRLKYKKVKKIYTITVVADIAMNFLLLGTIIKNGFYLYSMADIFVIAGTLAMLIIQLVMGMPIVKIGDLAEQRYRNLYPPVPSAQGFKQLEEEGYVLHADEELFETLGEKDKISENLNLDIFGEGNEELLKYVGGGKAREKQEAAVPQAKEDNTELISCPLCGSLNPVGAESCDFCGTDLLN